jgi:predicted nucleotidyltransferase
MQRSDVNSQTKQAILSEIRAHREEIKAAGVRRLGVFGSFVRGEQTPESDLDVLVEFDPAHKTFDNFMKVSLLLETLSDRRVDLVTTESLSPYIGPHIVKEVEYVNLGG